METTTGTVAHKLSRKLLSRFINREHEIAYFEGLLNATKPDKNIVSVLGPGGMGKTSLLVCYKALCEDRGIPVVLADLRDESANSIVGLQHFIRQSLGSYEGHYFDLYDLKLTEYQKVLSFLLASRASESEASAEQRDGNSLLLIASKELDLAFAGALNSLAQSMSRLVIELDTYEMADAKRVDLWLRNELLTKLTEYVVLVIAGRAPLDHEWMSQWGELIQTIILSPFTFTDWFSYAHAFGLQLPDKDMRFLHQFTGGTPLFAAFVVDLLRHGDITPEQIPFQLGKSVSDVVARLLRHLDQTTIGGLECIAVTGTASIDLIGSLLGIDWNSASEILNRLKTLSFIRQGITGEFTIHDAVRYFLVQELQLHSPNRYIDLHRRSFEYYNARLSSIEPRDPRWETAAVAMFRHQVVVDENAALALFRDFFRSSITAGALTNCQKLLRELGDARFTSPDVGAIVMKTRERCADILNCVESILSCWDNRNLVSVAERLCEALGLSGTLLLAGEPQGDLAVYGVSTSHLFRDTKLPPVLPIMVLCASVTGEDNTKKVYEVLEERLHSSYRICLVLSPQDVVSSQICEFVDKIRRAYAYDVIPLARSDLIKILIDHEPQQTLRRLVLSKADLVSASPFVVTGPTPVNMFFGREPELRMITERIATASFAVIGGRRIGKTSILHRLRFVRLPAAGFQCLYQDCSTASDRATFLGTVVDVWLSRASQSDLDDLDDEDYKESDQRLPLNTPRSFTELADLLFGEESAVILLDEIDGLIVTESQKGYPLFREFRQLAQRGRCQFLLAGERELLRALRDPSGPLFNFANEILIGRLDFKAVEELITRPMKQLEIELADEPAIVQKIYDFTSGHPNVTQRLCQRLVVRLNERQSRRITVDDIDAIVVDPDFLRRDFLDTYWERATTLEKLISLVMVKDDIARTLSSVQSALARVDIEADLNSVDAALERLVDLRNILKRTPAGYDFVVIAFPQVVSQSQRLDDLVALTRETYLAKGDVVAVEEHIPEEP